MIILGTAIGGTTLAAQSPTAQRAVLVTGASTGIGRTMTELLASKGHFVYAGARKDQDLADLNKIPNVQAIKLDVTSKADIAAAVVTVERGGRGLYGLVNNAGVAVAEPLIEMEEEDLTFVFDVNVYGPFRMTKAFSKLLIASKGRVVTTGSISGDRGLDVREGTPRVAQFGHRRIREPQAGRRGPSRAPRAVRSDTEGPVPGGAEPAPGRGHVAEADSGVGSVE